MASNELPENYNDLNDLALDMIDGLTDHGAVLGVTQWTAPALTARRDAFRLAKKTHLDAEKLEAAGATARKVANSNAKGFIATARQMLIGKLGSAPNTKWEEAGWAVGTTAVPISVSGRRQLLDKLVPWISKDATVEVAARDFTAVRGEAIRSALVAALVSLPGLTADRVKAAAADVQAEHALRKGMSSLIQELDGVLDADAPDWYYFGLVPPANPAAPAPPEHLEAHPAGPGVVVAGCDRGARARSYVFLVQKMGTDAAPVAQPAKRDPAITLEGLPHGSTVRVSVYAMNGAGHSATVGPVEVHVA